MSRSPDPSVVRAAVDAVSAWLDDNTGTVGDFGNQAASLTSSFTMPTDLPFSVYFEYAAEEGMVNFHHTIPLRGTTGASVEQIEDLTETALGECERLYPALQMVIWGGQSVAEALETAMMETVGEA